MTSYIPSRDLHGDGDDGNPAESAGNPREWVQLLRDYRGDGIKTCGNFAGMEFIAAGNPRVCYRDKSAPPFRCWTFQRWTTKRLLGLLLKQSPFLCHLVS